MGSGGAKLDNDRVEWREVENRENEKDRNEA